jgi:hypothetical protein
MEEISAVDILVENLKKRGINPEIQRIEKTLIQPGSSRMWNKKSVLAKFDSILYYAVDSYGAIAHSSNTFTGVYTEIFNGPDIDCTLYRKDWIHKLLVRNRIRAGVRYIDDYLTITSQSKYNPSSLLTQSDVNLFLKINEAINPLKLIIEKEYPPSIVNDSKKLMVGLETDYWVYKDAEIELLLNQGIRLIKSIKVASA